MSPTDPPLSKTELAIKEHRTLFPKSVKEALNRTVLKSVKYNNKLGAGRDVVAKGKLKGYKMVSLSLEERATCSKDCFHYKDCYCNHLPFATRFKYNKGLLKKIEEELGELIKKYGYVLVRLHVSGDFASVSYVKFWKKQLAKYPTLNVFGYTAWLKGPIHDEITKTIKFYGFNRFAIRFSSNSPFSQRMPNKRFATHETFRGKSVICPEQLGLTKSCITCGLCFNKNFVKSIKFLSH